MMNESSWSSLSSSFSVPCTLVFRAPCLSRDELMKIVLVSVDPVGWISLVDIGEWGPSFVWFISLYTNFWNAFHHLETVILCEYSHGMSILDGNRNCFHSEYQMMLVQPSHPYRLLNACNLCATQ
jgi:hypothetical protein